MPGSTSISVLTVRAVRTAIAAFVVGVAVAMAFLLLGAYCEACLATESSVRALVSMQALMWPHAHSYALVLGPERDAWFYQRRVALAVAENGLLYGTVVTSVWALVALFRRYTGARKV